MLQCLAATPDPSGLPFDVIRGVPMSWVWRERVTDADQ